MRFEFRFEADAIVEVVARGQASVESFARLDRELVAHPSWAPGMGILYDFRELDVSVLSHETTRRSSDITRSLAEKFGPARMACVMSRDVDFGIARMFEAMTAPGTPLEIRAFRSMDEAQAWLESPRLAPG